MENIRQATITIREPKQSKKVRIGSAIKPEIAVPVIEKWQSLIDTAAKIVNVPSGLIMRLNTETIEVFLKSNTAGNPYEVGEEAKLIYGLYCETVIGTQKKLTVSNATKDPVWKNNNPDIDLNMISYLGFPINWPDGEVFGTVCLLDNKENAYNELYEDLLQQLAKNIETDLNLLLTNEELKKKNLQLEKLNHTKSRFLSLITHDLRGNLGIFEEILNLAISKLNQAKGSDVREIMYALKQNAGSIYLTMESLLSWSKQDLIEIQPSKTKLNLISLIEDLLKFFDLAISMKNLNIIKQFNARQAFIYADENMISVGIRNILSNAIKYSEDGGNIIIRVSLKNDRHIIEIEDNGKGMRQDVKENLFSYYEPSPKNNIRNKNGAGIGLLLTKDFLNKNGAKLDVESELGKGSVFRITI